MASFNFESCIAVFDLLILMLYKAILGNGGGGGGQFLLYPGQFIIISEV